MKVYYVENAYLFHKSDCPYIKGVSNLRSCEEKYAISKGMTACPRCFEKKRTETIKNNKEKSKSTYSNLYQGDRLRRIYNKYPDVFREVLHDYRLLKDNAANDDQLTNLYIDYFSKLGKNGRDISLDYYSCAKAYLRMQKCGLSYSLADMNKRIHNKASITNANKSAEVLQMSSRKSNELKSVPNPTEASSKVDQSQLLSSYEVNNMKSSNNTMDSETMNNTVDPSKPFHGENLNSIKSQATEYKSTIHQAQQSISIDSQDEKTSTNIMDSKSKHNAKNPGESFQGNNLNNVKSNHKDRKPTFHQTKQFSPVENQSKKMSTNMIDPESKNKITKLFEYLKQYSSISQKTKYNINEEQFVRYLSEIPQYKNYVTFYTDKLNDDSDESDSNVLISVKRPEHFICNDYPYDSIKDWIKYDWQHSYKTETTHENKIEVTEDDGNKKIINFADNPKRVQDFDTWKAKRDEWQKEQKEIQSVDNFFDSLYRLYKDLDVDSETKEFVCGNGFISCSLSGNKLNYPLLTKRIQLKYDAANNSINICDTERNSQINSMLLNKYTTEHPEKHLFDNDGIKKITDENDENDYHPLDNNETVRFLQRSVKELNPKSKVLNEGETISENELRFTDTQIVLTTKPVLFVRNKISGVSRAIDTIISNVEKVNFVPETLMEIIGNNSVEEDDKPEEVNDIQELAELGGEDPDILLPLPANREQLEIARNIEKYNAVVVQGPPGTGKTHTIANLLGHFLAEGKSVLVTSDTKKALSVLKEKIPKNLQSLCVSMLDDNHEDMERSVSGIMDYQSSNNEYDIRKKVKQWTNRRNEIIDQLAETREHIRDIKNIEFKKIEYNGEQFSLSEMSKYVHDNHDLKDIIPGFVDKVADFPLNDEELSDLYSSNAIVSKDDEKNVHAGLPSPDELISPTSFSENIKRIKDYSLERKQISENSGFEIKKDINGFVLKNKNHVIHLSDSDPDNLKHLDHIISGLSEIPKWQKEAILDGKTGGAHKNLWASLIDDVKETLEVSQKYYETLIDNKINIKGNNLSEIRNSVIEIKDLYDRKGKIGKLDKISKKKAINIVFDNVKINDHNVNSSKGCEAVIAYIDLTLKREKTANKWDKLMSHDSNVPSFFDLSDEPEVIANKYIPDINKCLNWYSDDYASFISSVNSCGINAAELFNYNHLLPDEEILNNILKDIKELLPSILKIQELNTSLSQEVEKFKKGNKQLSSIYSNSKLFHNLKKAYVSKNPDEYCEVFNSIVEIDEMSSILAKRNKYIEKIKHVAPDWANALQNRIGIHANDTVPNNIHEAWKWKQFDVLTKYYDKQSFSELQKQSADLSIQYREATEKLSEYSAWDHLLIKVQRNKKLQQSLQGWADTVKKIGKTGKKAARYKKFARQQMAECQNAVPVWIMTTSQVYDNLNPGINSFDVVIVDEASQSGITVLPILYYGKKAVIVGDDKQINPSDIGANIENANRLNDSYLKDSGIPNYQLYTTQTSLYDIAKESFNPLMLKEHFRCVPAIIGFSNMLSYDYKILPLRDQSSSKLLPPLIPFNVKGHRDGKKNVKEAYVVIALLKAFISLPEYRNKTFGVISLLGDEQVRYIQQIIDIPAPEMEKHKILIGNSAQFQGDERDVIILTMVDSNEDEHGPLKMMGYGPDDSFRKRYNVAVSRAKDQLWVVNSLDMHRDLKPEDLRRRLLEYVNNPQQYKQRNEIQVNSESPFEESVANYLNSKGYKIKQQWPAGGYRIDMVAIDENTNKKIAIECDGEQWHSGEEKIKEDMARQTILERVGWTFIRIRGSEYYKDPEATMEHVTKMLDSYDVHPYSSSNSDKNIESMLEKKVIDKVNTILEEHKDDRDIIADNKRVVANYIANENQRKAEDKITSKVVEKEPASGAVTIEPLQQNQVDIPTVEKNIVVHKDVEDKKLSNDVSKPFHQKEDISETHQSKPIIENDDLTHDLLNEGISYFTDDNGSLVVQYDRKTTKTIKKICNKYSISPEYLSPSKANNKTGSWIIRKK